MTRTSIAAGFVAVLLALTACSSSSSSGNSTSSTSAGSGGSSATTASGPTITIKNFAFSGTMTVKAGAKVTVVNDDSTAHTLTDKATKKFDTGNITGNGGKGTFTAPTKAGSYPFGCTYHPNMKGTLVVQ
jgi:plastocyanin